MNLFAAWIFATQAFGAAPTLGLPEYLEQVKAKSPAARAALDGIESARLRLNEAEVPFSPELYSEYRLFDDQKEATNNFSPRFTRGRVWKVGVRKQTTFGLNADAGFQSQNTTLGVNPQQFGTPNFEQSSLTLSLQQSLWRNGFGEVTRESRLAQQAANRIALLEREFDFKEILLEAENTYWSLVSYNQIVALQVENVDRARRLRDWMKQRAGLRLFDDVDALQAQASFEKAEIDLQTSLNERAGLIRQFNTLRGQPGDKAEALAELPTAEFMTKTVHDTNKRMSREDFRKIFEQGQASDAEARVLLSKIRPQLDLVGSLSGNGFDASTGSAMGEATAGKHPSWAVGLVFSIPLDYSLVNDMKASYRAQRRAAVNLKEQARFSEGQVWEDLVTRKREAQNLFERSLSLEKLQTDLVKRERRRLLNGRSTTFQSINIEQGLAAAQISRVRAQLALLKLHNVLKQFVEMP